MVIKTPMVGYVMVGGMTLQVFLMSGAETTKTALTRPSKLAEVNVQRHIEGYLPEGPESKSRPFQTVRGIERLVTSTSTEDIDRSSGTYYEIRWWVPQETTFQ